MNTQKGDKLGIVAASGSYFIWGLLPLYWALLKHLPSLDILMYRIAFAFVFIAMLLLFSKQKAHYRTELKWVFTNGRVFMSIFTASILISLNWFIFIFAVSGEKVVDASLGYYINPLLNVVLATLFLKEKLSKAEVAAVASAAIGVLLLIIIGGHIPWASFGMALTFCLYGFIKRAAPLSATGGLFIETLLVVPVALCYFAFFTAYPLTSFAPLTIALLVGAGVVTAVPLLLFSYGAKRISFSLIGFLQYVAPTLMLLLGIFVFGEPFSIVQFFAFFFIWVGLVVFTSSRLLGHRQQKINAKT
ncbi:EamA family transporter RarD [Shouchella clausii]|uniref:Protein RarD n=1 Tax=Shouchella clausii TaxID=79880 RepID=A0A268RWA5_SHOCL|nr:EamA family transporter RarD [Shouchella clausii]PAD41547.1 protein RarD [Bacillus sp. 7520-S]MCY1106313.1 EamA family transporter RarD [Shouchella clausii]MEB5479334.1 EamA family transporter RarD [Shouchella clausii]MED4159978.1 EamA family transporter RarD [Shouchella clausii]MED4176770.1 EamA family transporter RarD [Shouchella clausii]